MIKLEGMKMKYLKSYTVFFLWSGFLFSSVGNIEDTIEFEEKTAFASRLGNASVKIDGRLEEPIWETALWYSEFHQRTPGNGTPATFQTEFAVFYTSEYLIIGARAYDPEPDKIRSILSRKDDYTESDWLYVSIDSYNDNRTAFEFGINAAGVHHDLRRYNDEEGFDENFDAIWEGSASINDQGWSAEWKIPFSELRFTSAENMEWGFNVYRELPRMESELSIWNWWSNSTTGFVSRYGSLHGLSNIVSRQPVVISPYLSNQTNISDNLVTPYHGENYDLLNSAGADIRYTSTNGMAFTATINPDFGQVEADPADFNLTNFETYLPEKRPFFVEGNEIFNFPLGFGDGGEGSNSLFYTRRIGRNPHGSPQIDWNKYDSETTTESPEMTKIIGAAKLSGKTDNGFSVGILNAVTAEEKGTVYYSDESKDISTVEPLTNYLVARVKQDYNEGATSVGGIFTSVNRNLDHTGMDYLHEGAYTGGIDLSTDFFDRNYSFEGGVSFSHVTGDTLAMQITQRSSARYFQRSNKTHSEFDPKATSLTGNAFRAILSKNKGHVRGAFIMTGMSPGFEINDLGYSRQSDIIYQVLWLQYTEWEPKKWLQRYSINTNVWNSYTYGRERLSTGMNINGNLQTLNNYSVGGGVNYNFPGLNTTYNRGGPALYTAQNVNFWGYFQTDSRKDLVLTLNPWGNRSGDDVVGVGLWSKLSFQVLENLSLSLSTSVNKLDDTWAWVGKAKTDNGETRYIWSDARFRTINTTLRTDLTLSNSLSIQYYAQPYLTVGEMFNFKRVGNPLSADYNERFLPVDAKYNSETGAYDVDEDMDGSNDYSFYGITDYNYKQFRSNLVVRWEYSLGSVFYFVWSQGFTDYEPFTSLNYGKNMKHMFNTVGDNAIMVKLSYALNI